jgi:hypothetical protein
MASPILTTGDENHSKINRVYDGYNCKRDAKLRSESHFAI